MNKFSTVLLVCFSLLFETAAFGYEVETHQAMTTAALGVSDISNALKSMGLLGSIEEAIPSRRFYSFPFFGTITITEEQTVNQWFREGVTREDDLPRFINHFYNPLTQMGLNSTVKGRDSLTWGLEPADIPGQDYSYRDAKNYLYQSILAPAQTDRQANFALLFRTLGDVVHLVEDIGQPQHTRNDSHGGFIFFGPTSLYEKYTRDHPPDAFLAPSYIPQFLFPDYFWSTKRAGTGLISLDSGGLADFSNANFVTAGTNFTGSLRAILPNAFFPNPTGAGAAISTVDISTLLDLSDPPLHGKMDFIQTNVIDTYTNSTAPNDKTSTFSMFDYDLDKFAPGTSAVFALNRFNFKAAHQFLIPRAVGYSAGLINYFFRGKIEISLPDEGVYGMVDHSTLTGIDNLSGFKGFKTIKLNLRNITPDIVNRNGAFSQKMDGGTLVAVAKFHRNLCYQDDLADKLRLAGDTTCVSSKEEIVTSAPITGATLLPNVASPTPFPFNFSAQGIPINATDLYIQVVYRGPLGTETDAVVVATKDVSEPTYLVVMNLTDYFLFSGVFYTQADFAATHPGYPAVRARDQEVFLSFAEKGVVDPVTGSAVFPVEAHIAKLPAGRFARLAFIAESGVPVKAKVDGSFGFASLNVYPSVYQLDKAANVYYYRGDARFRNVRYDSLFNYYYSLFGDHNTGDFSVITNLTGTAAIPYPTDPIAFPLP